jgi:ankyrin repeat protein
MTQEGALIKAVIENDVERVTRLLSTPITAGNININFKDGEPLIRAARNGYLEMVQLLIRYGAKPGARKFEALRHAASNGYIDVVRELVSYGGVDACDYGAFRHAAENGHLEVVRFLRELGSDITACDNNAIRRAFRNGHDQVVHYLRTQGASLPGLDSLATEVIAETTDSVTGISNDLAAISISAESSSDIPVAELVNDGNPTPNA